MQSELNQVLLKLSEASPESIVSQLQKLFITITNLSDDELVATYQTVNTISRRSSLAHADVSTLVNDIKRALVAQMQQLVLRGIDTSAMRIRFKMVTGVRFQTLLDTSFEPQNW